MDLNILVNGMVTFEKVKEKKFHPMEEFMKEHSIKTLNGVLVFIFILIKKLNIKVNGETISFKEKGNWFWMIKEFILVNFTTINLMEKEL